MTRKCESSPTDSKRIVTASCDNTARVWNSDTGEALAELKGHTDWVNSASFSPDGKRIVTASDDRTCRVWDSSTGGTLAELKGHRYGVFLATFSPDGERIVTTSYDNRCRVWDSGTGKALAELKGHADWVQSATFSPDGKRIVTTSADGWCCIWRRYRPEWWWGIFYMLEFWFAAGFAVALVWSLFADRRAFARMDAEAARAKENRSRPATPLSETP